MVKILVFGQNGQLGRCIAHCASEYPEVELQLVDRTICDLEHPTSVAALVDEAGPDVVINAAGYTAVDLAESEPERAQTINCDAVRAMAESARDHSIPLIHFSTDYVFDGTSRVPYCETDLVNPQSIYGSTKFAGEEAVREVAYRHLIFRTSWVYSPFGKNFVKTMLRLMEKNQEIKVVDDQTGCPTNAQDLAHAVLRVIPDILKPDCDVFGTYHLVGNDVMTWCEFARQIQNTAACVLGERWAGRSCKITAVTSNEFLTVAKRPSYSVMSTDRFVDTFGFSLPKIGESLRTALSDLNKGEAHA